MMFSALAFNQEQKNENKKYYRLSTSGMRVKFACTISNKG